MIKNIETNSPADLGGLKPGDKILVINNENVEEASYTTVVNRLKEALTNKIDLNLIVMNIIEYNMFKEKNPAIDNCNFLFYYYY
jgi:C-terminal processing protease CtpA/Prc